MAGHFAVLLLLASAAVVLGVDVKYTELVKSGAVIDMGMKISIKDVTNKEATPYNDGKVCEAKAEDCQVLSYDDDSVVIVEFAPPKKVTTASSVGGDDGVELKGPVSVTFKACFEKEWTDNRKWRKAKDTIKKDKRCGKKMGEAKLDDGTFEFTLPSDTPKGQFFITALVECERADGRGKEFCGVDTTGGLTTLAKDASADLKTSDELYYITTNMDSRPPGLVTGVIVLSCTSWVLLIGYFVYERILKKNK